MIEVYKHVVGYEGKYFVSNKGRVISVARRKKGKVLKEKILRSGYAEVVLYKDGKPKHCLVHRLVAEAFLPKIVGKEFVNHKDGNKTNNRVLNLEWCSRSENQKHAFLIGLQKPSKHGEIPVVATNIKTGMRIQFCSISECCRRLNLHRWSVRSVLNGIQKQSKGYNIEFVENQINAERKGV